MKTIRPFSPAVLLLAAVCALPLSAQAQGSDAKRALAVKLAQLEQKHALTQITDQLTAGAVQPLLMGWSQRLDETVPPARQKEVREKLDVELKKFTDNTRKVIEASAAKNAEAALVPLYMDKLSEDELKTIVAFMESPASTKYEAVNADTGNAWAKKVIEATRSAVEAHAKSFDTAANKIVNAAPSAAKSSDKK